MQSDLIQEHLETKHHSYNTEVLLQYSLQQLFTGGFEYLLYFLQVLCNQEGTDLPRSALDVAGLLEALLAHTNSALMRNYLYELKYYRNCWAHQNRDIFNYPDLSRFYDTVLRVASMVRLDPHDTLHFSNLSFLSRLLKIKEAELIVLTKNGHSIPVIQPMPTPHAMPVLQPMPTPHAMPLLQPMSTPQPIRTKRVVNDHLIDREQLEQERMKYQQ